MVVVLAQKELEHQGRLVAMVVLVVEVPALQAVALETHQ
jgi:hypothetical protein